MIRTFFFGRSIGSRRFLKRNDIKFSSRHSSSRPSSLDAREIPTHRQRLLRRVHARVPLFLHPYTEKLVNAPVTHLTSFLILHEITAIVPLLGLTAFFHYSNWLPKSVGEWKWASDGVDKYGHYLKKKGWLGQVEKDEDGNLQGSYWARMGNERFRVVLEYVPHLSYM